MGTVFDIAKANTGMPLAEVDRLLDSDTYEERMVAVSILDFKARAKNADRAALYDLWMRRLDRIDTWDYIDRSAPRVVGWYLLDKPRDVLFELARSDNRWHRRAAITAAFWIIRSGDLDDPLALCEILAADPEHLVQTNVGVALREIGRVDRERLEEFLEGAVLICRLTRGGPRAPRSPAPGHARLSQRCRSSASACRQRGAPRVGARATRHDPQEGTPDGRPFTALGPPGLEPTTPRISRPMLYRLS